VSRDPKTRAEAKRMIEQLYGWPVEYGPIEDYDDQTVIQVAVEQYEVDEFNTNPSRPVDAPQMAWIP
jgi:hypothetical protein